MFSHYKSNFCLNDWANCNYTSIGAELAKTIIIHMQLSALAELIMDYTMQFLNPRTQKISVATEY